MNENISKITSVDDYSKEELIDMINSSQFAKVSRQMGEIIRPMFSTESNIRPIQGNDLEYLKKFNRLFNNN